MENHFIKEYLYQFFNLHRQKINCQVATYTDKNPHIRTMNLYDMTNEGELIFLTDTRTNKWHSLTNNPRAAICLYQHPRQVIVEAEVRLKTITTDKTFVRFCWENYLDQYWRNYYLSQTPEICYQANDVSSIFGVIILQPDFFEILEINESDYLLSTRRQFRKSEQIWTETEVAPV